MKCALTTDASAFRQFAEQQQSDQFLQSWDWGEFQVEVGRRVLRLVVHDEQDRPLGTAQVLSMPLPLGKKYFYLPRGPVFRAQAESAEKRAVVRVITRELREVASRGGEWWLRFEPPFLQDGEVRLADELRGEHMILPLNQTVQPQSTQLLDLLQSEEELLAGMHQKTRYNIRLAEKKDVHVSVDERPDAFEEFWRLMETTADRNHLTNHPRRYYETMYRTLGSADRHCRVRLYRAEYQGKTLAMIMTLSYGATVIYLHGASSNEDRNVMAPYLIQWRAILDAKKAGASTYDFWGVTTSEDPRHHWAGITKFKKGFGGRLVTYAPAADVVFQSAWYQAYRLLKKVRK